MKLKVLKCPECRANIEIEKGRDFCYCNYCGCKIILDNEKKETTINKNININKNVTYTSRTIDDAEIIRAKTAEKEKKYGLYVLAGVGVLWCLIMGICFYMMGVEDRAARKAIAEGKISAGSNEDYEGENYLDVVEQLETLGFENVTTIDLGDSGVMFWTADEVESVSISGDSSFSVHDYFYPNESIIVKYH